MAEAVLLDAPLTPHDIMAVARGAKLELSDAAWSRLKYARAIVDGLVAQGIRGYGINTGVGALCDVIISPKEQSKLSHNLLFSHACGVGDPLEREAVRAIMATQINNFALGKAGVDPETVAILLGLLNADVIPVVPSRGSVGYLTHMAAIGLLVIGAGQAIVDGQILSGAQALAKIGKSPRRLGAKEGLCLVNGTHCSTGMAILAHRQLSELCDWADAAGAFSYALLGRQESTFAGSAKVFRNTPGVQTTTQNLQRWLTGMRLPDKEAVSTQDPLSLRAMPQVHGAIRDELRQIHEILTQELCEVSDNPAVGGTPDAPEVYSQANAVGAAIAFAADRMTLVAAQLGAISERRIDRLVNPLVSGLPAFLSGESGTGSGFMIAQYTAASLVAENATMATPASLGGGITSALQEDILTHATPAARKALSVTGNTREILAIELLCAAQALDLTPRTCHAPALNALYERVRGQVAAYQDDRPLSEDIRAMSQHLRASQV